MLSQIYSNDVALYNVTHTYHIVTLNTHFVLHGYLGELYESLQDRVDTVGEQMVILGEDVPTVFGALTEAGIEEKVTTDCYEIVEVLEDAFEKALQDATEVSKSDIDEGTRNIVADEMLFLGKVLARLHSLAK